MMNTAHPYPEKPAGYELCFPSLANGGAFTFPCDKDGRVDLDALSTSARLAYLYARTLIGRQFARPAVRPLEVT